MLSAIRDSRKHHVWQDKERVPSPLVYCILRLVKISTLAPDVVSLALLALWRWNDGGYPLLTKTSLVCPCTDLSERHGYPRKSHWFLKLRAYCTLAIRLENPPTSPSVERVRHLHAFTHRSPFITTHASSGATTSVDPIT